MTRALTAAFAVWLMIPAAGVNGDSAVNLRAVAPSLPLGELRPILTLEVVDNVPVGVVAPAGSAIEYLFTIHNVGDEPATNMRLTAFVPALTTAEWMPPWNCGADPRPTGRTRCDLTKPSIEPGHGFSASLRAIVDEPLPVDATFVTLEAVATADNLGITGEDPWVSVATPVTASTDSGSYLARVFLPTIVQAP